MSFLKTFQIHVQMTFYNGNLFNFFLMLGVEPRVSLMLTHVPPLRYTPPSQVMIILLLLAVYYNFKYHCYLTTIDYYYFLICANLLSLLVECLWPSFFTLYPLVFSSVILNNITLSWRLNKTKQYLKDSINSVNVN